MNTLQCYMMLKCETEIWLRFELLSPCTEHFLRFSIFTVLLALCVTHSIEKLYNVHSLNDWHFLVNRFLVSVSVYVSFDMPSAYRTKHTLLRQIVLVGLSPGTRSKPINSVSEENPKWGSKPSLGEFKNSTRFPSSYWKPCGVLEFSLRGFSPSFRGFRRKLN